MKITNENKNNKIYEKIEENEPKKILKRYLLKKI